MTWHRGSTIWQDLTQAERLYKDQWESFISNAGIVHACCAIRCLRRALGEARIREADKLSCESFRGVGERPLWCA
jgi:hypothetical protein